MSHGHDGPIYNNHAWKMAVCRAAGYWDLSCQWALGSVERPWLKEWDRKHAGRLLISTIGIHVHKYIPHTLTHIHTCILYIWTYTYTPYTHTYIQCKKFIFNYFSNSHTEPCGTIWFLDLELKRLTSKSYPKLMTIRIIWKYFKMKILIEYANQIFHISDKQSDNIFINKSK